jgi:CRP/FNR family cyclic AMP-dependent transcriptional regulator
MISDQPLFSELSPENLELIANHGVVRQFPKNTVLITEGDDSDSLYVIHSGKVKVYLSDESGKEFILNIHGPGEYFGELAMIDNSPRSASVITLEPCKMSVVPRSEFKNCLAENPEISYELIRSLSGKVKALTESARNLALLDVYGRVARTLLNMAEGKDGEQVIEQRLTHQDIANLVGASREMVSRIMKDLTAGGYVETRERKIVICNKLPHAW